MGLEFFLRLALSFLKMHKKMPVLALSEHEELTGDFICHGIADAESLCGVV